MSPVKILLIWLIYLMRGLLGRRRFLGLTPPFARVQRLYDRVNRNWVKFNVRDSEDWLQLEHIFLNEEFDLSGTGRRPQIEQLYRKMLDTGRTPLIIDLGANIGLASAYFHRIYPDAQIIAVEPDKGNCEMARRNLPAKSTLIEAAAASHPGRAKLIDTGRNCGFRVDPCAGGDIQLVTVADLLELAEGSHPFMIKIDIEGFEEDLFSKNVQWVDLFPIILTELHDWMLPNRRVTRNFLSVMATREREFMHFGGYVVSLSSPL